MSSRLYTSSNIKRGRPRKRWLLLEDIHNKKKLEALFGLIDLYCFQGHTHVPCIITADLQCKTPGEVDGLYRLEGRKTICNVGSVGQPRDGDWRASYVLLHGDIVRFRSTTSTRS
ncbi:MAG: hypothetical protein AB7K24_10160 [Gemmataceae bacterium]